MDVPLKDCTTAVLTTLAKDMRKAEKVKYSATRDGDREIFDIVCNLSKQKNGEKFKKLYYSGDYSDYGSHSEADLALCTLIAFRTGDDPEMIDAVFRGSALMREKWEREDYRTVKRWQDRSRRNSWTPEMKEAARQRELERRATHGC